MHNVLANKNQVWSCRECISEVRYKAFINCCMAKILQRLN